MYIQSGRKYNNAPGEVSSAFLHLHFWHLTKTFSE